MQWGPHGLRDSDPLYALDVRREVLCKSTSEYYGIEVSTINHIGKHIGLLLVGQPPAQ